LRGTKQSHAKERLLRTSLAMTVTSKNLFNEEEIRQTIHQKSNYRQRDKHGNDVVRTRRRPRKQFEEAESAEVVEVISS
jgi:hypothetical protein